MAHALRLQEWNYVGGFLNVAQVARCIQLNKEFHAGMHKTALGGTTAEGVVFTTPSPLTHPIVGRPSSQTHHQLLWSDVVLVAQIFRYTTIHVASTFTQTWAQLVARRYAPMFHGPLPPPGRLVLPEWSEGLEVLMQALSPHPHTLTVKVNDGFSSSFAFRAEEISLEGDSAVDAAVQLPQNLSARTLRILDSEHIRTVDVQHMPGVLRHVTQQRPIKWPCIILVLTEVAVNMDWPAVLDVIDAMVDTLSERELLVVHRNPYLLVMKVCGAVDVGPAAVARRYTQVSASAWSRQRHLRRRSLIVTVAVKEANVPYVALEVRVAQ
ncbi:hypothetical protein JKP88DRAFT_243836 [Tribonema minus]|uniref:Uncharacterized protein n=1 Tax=Tribonema minus TaxID=303371 RepID=A0A835Z491_9STRA|nr:hypothetical protein JKP88DRAFT_243836 [Tribonema minus]